MAGPFDMINDALSGKYRGPAGYGQDHPDTTVSGPSNTEITKVNKADLESTKAKNAEITAEMAKKGKDRFGNPLKKPNKKPTYQKLYKEDSSGLRKEAE